MAQSFGEGFVLGQQMAAAFRQRSFEQSIDDAGKLVQEEIQKEKDFKDQQRQLVESSKPVDTMSAEPVNPSVYQQGDSIGLRGYQVGNKPIQTTVPTAPPGYMSRPGEEVTPGIDTNGYYEPEPNTSANPATAQTLIGNYGTTASFKGEKPTQADTLRMQQDTTDQFQDRPFTGKNEQVNNLADLAVNKPETTQDSVKPKVLNTLNEKVIAADLAKDAYEYNMRVIRKLQQSGNARAALEYEGKVATAELTLAQADHTKFTTMAALSKKVGDMASNALEAIQEPNADVNKIFLDTMTSAKEDLGYTGKIPFSLDPRENIKTLKMLEKNSGTVLEKAELGLRQAATAQKSVFENSELAIKQERLTLDKINTALAINKDNREQFTSSFTRTAELTKLQYQAINSINSTINEKDKEALKPVYEANLKLLQDSAKVLNSKGINVTVPNMGIESSSTIKTQPVATNVQPGAAPAAVNPQPGATPVKPVNTLYSSGILKGKESDDTAGGYNPETPPAKTSTELTKEKAAKELRIKQLKAIIESRQKSLNPGMETESDLERRKQNSIKAKQNREAVKEVLTGKKKRQAQEEELLKAQKELEALTKS